MKQTSLIFNSEYIKVYCNEKTLDISMELTPEGVEYFEHSKIDPAKYFKDVVVKSLKLKGIKVKESDVQVIEVDEKGRAR